MSDVPAESSPRRPTLAVATVGHHRHGKTTLTSALTAVLARRPGSPVRLVPVAELDRQGGGLPFGAGDPPPTMTVRASETRWATDHRAFVQVDGPGRRRWLKNAVRAQSLADAVVLVVEGPESVRAQTHEHLLVARSLGIEQLVVFIGKCDGVQDLEWLDLVEHDIRELLVRCGYDGDATRILRGAALPAAAGDPRWEAGVHDLIGALEAELTVPARDGDGAPLLYIHHRHGRRPPRGGAIVEARVRRGVVRRGMSLALVGFGSTRRVLVHDLEVDHRKVDRAEAGEFVGLHILRPDADLPLAEVRSGQALVGGDVAPPGWFSASLELFAADNGGRRTPMPDGHHVSLMFGATIIPAILHLGEPLQPGASAEARIEPFFPVHLEPGMRFVIRDGNQGANVLRDQRPQWGGTSGHGTVLRLLPPDETTGV